MYYKNYWVSYTGFGEKIVCCEMGRDMTNFVSTDKDPDYKYIKRPFEINRYEYEHARDYLDENGLFMGIFPPEVIEQDIKEWNEEQNKLKKELNNNIEELSKVIFKKPLKESYIKEYQIGDIDKETLLMLLESHNKKAYDKEGIIFTFEDYKPILNKYGIKYKVNEEIGIWTGKNIL